MHETEQGGLEGLFDAQLALPLGGTRTPELFSRVVKRDGREEPFDTAKIASAIARASASAAPNEAEHAWDLAKAVRVHLWKELGDRAPHVDQIHEAVERVLVAMSRQRTALAYSRYRVRRARQRASGEGVRVALGLLEEDAYIREAMGGRSDALLVRTSKDTLAAWDRAKIVAALMRETGLRENTAEAIALEVEQQIAAARIDALTASLVRELVDAKLAEHGLAEFRERHRRLGVPLYDTALMLRGMAPLAAGHTPEDTERLLARVLKKEYALAEVFSSQVAEAHLRGDLHIDGLGDIDRFGGARLPLKSIAGTAWEGLGSPESAVALLGRWRQTAKFLQGYAQGPCAWVRLGEAMSPALDALEGEGLRQFAEMFLFEFAAPAGRGGAMLAHAGWPAQGDGSGKFLETVLDTMIRARERGVVFGGLQLEVRLAAELLGGFPPREEFPQLVRAVCAGVPLVIRFARAGAVEPGPQVWLQTVALNLPRAVRHVNEIGGVAAWLREQLHVAAVAHEEKRLFMEELWARGADGPFAALRAWPGWGGFAPERCVTRIAVDGLLDAVQGMPLAAEEEGVLARAEALLGMVRQVLDEVVQGTAASLVLCANGSREISERFAALTEHAEEVGPEVPGTFATGIALPGRLSVVEAAAAHGRLCAFLDEAPALEVALGPEDYGAGSITGLLQRVLTTTECGAISFRAL